LFTTVTGMSAALSTCAVPRVAISSKPSSCSFCATGGMRGLSVFFTLMNTLPLRGSFCDAPACALAIARPKVLSMPMTSPVDFISGPSNVSTPMNFMKGNTVSLTLMRDGDTSWVTPISLSLLRTMTLAAILAKGTPVALLTKGTVREARGFTSST
jgi:hypothetical protein